MAKTRTRYLNDRGFAKTGACRGRGAGGEHRIGAADARQPEPARSAERACADDAA